MVLYRKYRPQQLEDLDTPSVRDRLRSILTSAYAPHAYLFSGSRGAGKTSAARIVAQFFLCEKRLHDDTPHQWEEVRPCGICSSCNAVKSGRHMDCIEIDAASNRGIDDVRQLRETIALAPVMGKVKVYIIDEVHMMTTEAFNALLKTLEEPPSHAIFILATTELEKIPETIRSRATHILFPKATQEEVVRSLGRVVNGENATISSDVLRYLASRSDGSFRDATKYLEQLLSEGITDLQDARKVLGGDADTVFTLLSFLQKKHAREALHHIELLSKQGVDMRRYTADLLHALHDMLLLIHGVSSQNGGTDLGFTSGQVQEIIKLLSRVYTEMKTASKSELPLEIAVVEWCQS